MVSAPNPPEGYHCATEYDELGGLKEQLLSWKGQGLMVAQLVLITVAAIAVGLRINDFVAFTREFGPIALVVLLAGGIYGTTVVHEYVHWVIDRFLGYDPEIRWKLLNPYVIMPDRMVRRGDNIVSLLAPFFSINTVALLVILAGFNPVVTLLSQIVFVQNTNGAIGDLRGALYLFRCPVGTQIWLTDEDGRQSFTFEPEIAEGSA